MHVPDNETEQFARWFGSSPALFPNRPRFLASSGGAQGSWVRQFKAFCQFENRYIRDIGIIVVPQDFFQKQDVLEYSPCHRFLVTPSHKNLLINQKTEMRAARWPMKNVLESSRYIIQQPPLAAITEISKDARLGANNMPAIQKTVIFDLPTGRGVEKSLHLQIEMSALWQQRNHCSKALYTINRQPLVNAVWDTTSLTPSRIGRKAFSMCRFKQDGNCSLRL
jgi:hypothetical protein